MRPYTGDNIIDELDEYAINAPAKTGPNPTEYQKGTVPMDSLPSSWWNFFIGRLTKNIQRTSHAAQDIYAEMASVLTEAGITPDPANHKQLLDGIKKVGGDQVRAITTNGSHILQPDLTVIGYEYIIVTPSVTSGTVIVSLQLPSSIPVGCKYKGLRFGNASAARPDVLNIMLEVTSTAHWIAVKHLETITCDLRESSGTYNWFISPQRHSYDGANLDDVAGSMASYNEYGTLTVTNPVGPFDAVNLQYYQAQVLGRQVWLPAVDLHNELPTPADIPDYDPTVNYLCRVMHDDPEAGLNGVWQLIAESTEWTFFSDNADFIDQAELDAAIATEVTNRNSAISTAIATEVTNRNSAISTAIATEVTNRNSAISTAVASKQVTLVSGTNIKTIGGVSLLGSGDIALPSQGISEFTAIIDSSSAWSSWLNVSSPGDTYRSVLVGSSTYSSSVSNNGSWASSTLNVVGQGAAQLLVSNTPYKGMTLASGASVCNLVVTYNVGSLPYSSSYSPFYGISSTAGEMRDVSVSITASSPLSAVSIYGIYVSQRGYIENCYASYTHTGSSDVSTTVTLLNGTYVLYSQATMDLASGSLTVYGIRGEASGSIYPRASVTGNRVYMVIRTKGSSISGSCYGILNGGDSACTLNNMVAVYTYPSNSTTAASSLVVNGILGALSNNIRVIGNYSYVGNYLSSYVLVGGVYRSFNKCQMCLGNRAISNRTESQGYTPYVDSYASPDASIAVSGSAAGGFNF